LPPLADGSNVPRKKKVGGAKTRKNRATRAQKNRSRIR